MSAFFVSAETIADTVSVLVAHERMPVNRRALGQKLWHMNAQALVERYGDKITEYQPAIDAYAAPRASSSKWQRVQSARCFLYQCSEGDVPELDLFKAVDAAVDCAVESLGGINRAELNACVWGR